MKKGNTIRDRLTQTDVKLRLIAGEIGNFKKEQRFLLEFGGYLEPKKGKLIQALASRSSLTHSH